MTKYPESNNKVNPNYVPESSVKKEYIEREALLAFLYNTQTMSRQRVIQCIESKERFPVADVEPVRHGKWTLLDSFEYSLELQCSACNSKVILSRRSPLKYCPHCGTKMDKE